MNTYERTRLGIIDAGYDPSIVESIGQILSNSIDPSLSKSLLLTFEKEAEKLPWPQDYDFGALVLQNEARKSKNSETAKLMLSSAIDRARWCAQCATSGGEGLARSQHIQELQDELSQYN